MKTVIFRDNQELPAEDVDHVGKFARESIDQLLRDAGTDQKRFSGFAVTANGATSIKVAPGRLFYPTTLNYTDTDDSGAYSRSATLVYDKESDTDISVLTLLPITNKKIVAVVVWGQTIETATKPRDFLINADSNETEPQVVATEERRYANVEVVAGVESADPQPPTVTSTNLAVCYVTLNTTGIESITMIEASRMPSIEGNSTRVGALELWRAQIGPQVDSIASDVAALANVERPDTALIVSLAADMARVKEAVEIPADATDYAADRFLTEDHTDTEDVTYNAKIEDGIRFADDAANEAQLAVLDIYNELISITGAGFLLPKYTHKKRVSIAGYYEALPINQYQMHTQTMVKRGVSRRRVRYGEIFTKRVAGKWWQSGDYDARRGLFYKDGDTFQVIGETNNVNGLPKRVAVRRIWIDYVTDVYWDAIVTSTNVLARHVSETFLNANDGWLTKVGLYFPSVAGTGDVRLSICEVEAGAPKVDAVIADVTVAAADLKTYPTVTEFPIGPVFLQAGKRYAFIVSTSGSHTIAMVQGANYTDGTFFVSSDGVYNQGDITKDIKFDLWFAEFQYPRIVVDLAPLSLSGGIFAIDIMAEAVIPASTGVYFQIQVDSVWSTIPFSGSITSDVPAPPLNQAPPPALVPLRVVFEGTNDVMPGIGLSGSRQRVTRPKTAFKHVSTERTLAAASDEIHVITDLEDFDDAHHTLTTKIVTPGPVVETADTVTDVELPDGRIRRTSVFSLGATVSSYVITIEGTTDSILAPFDVSERVDLAF